SVNLNNVSFNGDEILVQRNAKAGTQALTNRLVTIDLDCTLDQDLIEEGLARELVSRIQQARKSSNLKVDDKIDVKILSTSSKVQEIFNKFSQYICEETLIKNYSFQSDAQGETFIFGTPVVEESLQVEDSFGFIVSKVHSK